jgi:hypothetical protein
VLFNTYRLGMNLHHTNTDSLADMNGAVRLLWRHGYSLEDCGTRVIVRDPVHATVLGSAQLRVCGYQSVVIHSCSEARRFVDARN